MRPRGPARARGVSPLVDSRETRLRWSRGFCVCAAARLPRGERARPSRGAGQPRRMQVLRFICGRLCAHRPRGARFACRLGPWPLGPSPVLRPGPCLFVPVFACRRCFPFRGPSVVLSSAPRCLRSPVVPALAAGRPASRLAAALSSLPRAGSSPVPVRPARALAPFSPPLARWAGRAPPPPPLYV